MFESRYLKDDIKNIQQLLAIPSLKNLKVKDLSKLLKLSKIRQYDDGEVIIKEGDIDNWLYFILSGEVRVVTKGVEVNTLKETGEVFGELRMVDGLSRSASVYSVGKTTCLAVDISAKNRLDSGDELASLLVLLYKVIAEFISIRFRILNEENINIKKELTALKSKAK